MKIAVVEDSPVMQKLLQSLLARKPGRDVVGVAASDADAIALIERTRPDLVLLDLFLSPGHGLQVLQAVRDAGNPCKVLVLTNEVVHDEYRRRGALLGVLSFHDKGEGLAQLIGDLERVVGEA